MRLRVRTLLAVLLVSLALPAQPAAAGTGGTCSRFEAVFGITAAGGLAEHDYCVDGTGAGLQRTIPVTNAGWGDGTALWGGTDTTEPGQSSVLYRVTSSGRLFWYKCNILGIHGTATPIGSRFGDWSRYRSLFSTGGGVIYGVDRAGRVLRWSHLGWRDGTDRWQGPEVVGRGFGTGRRLLGVATSGGAAFFGTDAHDPHRIVYWRADGRRAGRADDVAGPVQSGSYAWGEASSGYGLAPDGVIVRLSAENGRHGTARWSVTRMRTTGFARVIGVGVRSPLTARTTYEWQ